MRRRAKLAVGEKSDETAEHFLVCSDPGCKYQDDDHAYAGWEDTQVSNKLSPFSQLGELLILI